MLEQQRTAVRVASRVVVCSVRQFTETICVLSAPQTALRIFSSGSWPLRAAVMNAEAKTRGTRLGCGIDYCRVGAPLFLLVRSLAGTARPRTRVWRSGAPGGLGLMSRSARLLATPLADLAWQGRLCPRIASEATSIEKPTRKRPVGQIRRCPVNSA